YFGLRSDPADAFNQAFRIPNFLQNLFGEGVLSASFIPIYSRLLAQGDEEESGRVAGAVAAILGLAASALVLLGVLATPLFIDVIAPGFHGAKRELAIRIVRVLFPGAGLLVMSAWCLGILNSHRKFFLSYTAPVVWNFAMLGALVAFGGRMGEASLAVVLAWGSVAGSALQLGVQAPEVLRLVRRLRVRLDTSSESVREVLRNFVPVFISRGVVQISAFVDGMLASPLPTGAVTGLANAQTLYTLPVSLFGMSVSAAELPAMSSALGDEAQVAGQLRQRLNAGLRQIAFFIVPSAMAFLALGDVVAGGGFHVREVQTRRCDVCMGRSGRIGGGAAGVHPGASLFVHILCASRHAHAVALCPDPRGADHFAGIRLRPLVAGMARDRPPVGRRGAYGLGGRCGLGW